MKRFLSFRVLASIGAVMLALAITAPRTETQAVTEAPTGFDVSDNGFAREFCANERGLTDVDPAQSPGTPDGECNFDTAVEEFTGPEDEAAGLGPIFNMAGCGECHFTPALGGSSHISEKRAGFFANGVFTDHSGGSLIQDRSAALGFQETITDRTPQGATLVTAQRMSLGIFGDGFVEAIANGTLQDIAAAQPQAIRGQAINVPVLEKPGQSRVGRFGWKDQQASLLSFSADAYVNEMGITSPLQPDENTSNGRAVPRGPTAPATDTDDDGGDVELFALFMRSLKAPARGPQNATTNAGSQVFDNIGCAGCHVRSITTAAPFVRNNRGQLVRNFINGGALAVLNAVGNKTIHPFGDFLLHDIGTGDGIVQNGGPTTRNKVRTAPLWGLRTRGRFMHDGNSLSLTDAIRRHTNQAEAASDAFNALSNTNRNNLIAFLNSL
jgi:CxxC motif-containing protein (DUF1111 family)